MTAFNYNKFLAVSFLVILALIFKVDAQAAKKTAYKVGKKFDMNQRRAQVLKNPQFVKAVADFQDGKVAQARDAFENLDRHGSCCDTVHYYIAQCYQHFNQIAVAQMHYEWVLTYSPDPQLRYYSQVATNQLSYYSGHRSFAGSGLGYAQFRGGGASQGGGRSVGFG